MLLVPSKDFPPIIEKSFTIDTDHGSATDNNSFTDDTYTKNLNFVMLGCETKEPYGPLTHTAQLFIDLLGMAAVKATTTSLTAVSAIGPESQKHRNVLIRIHVYNVQQMEYPVDSKNWDEYDGVLIPGSFSSAYDADPWIERLKFVIQNDIVPFHRPTLGICFGHQIFAHSFTTNTKIRMSDAEENVESDSNIGGGRTVKTPSGPRAGQFTMPLTKVGTKLLSELQSQNATDHSNETKRVQLYFTHGDMVELIPNVAIALGGDDVVPIQSVAYFPTTQDAERYKNHNETVFSSSNDTVVLPYAFTMQAHPEYSTSIELGVNRTLFRCIDAMERRHVALNIPPREDSITNFNHIQNDSVAVVARIGQILGWF
jgi:Glutamine amidotransferase class-I